MGLALQPLEEVEDLETGPQCLTKDGAHSIGLQRCNPSDRAQGWALHAADDAHHVLVHVESQQCVEIGAEPRGYESEERNSSSPPGIDSAGEALLPFLAPCGTYQNTYDVLDEWDELEGFVVTTARCNHEKAAASDEDDRVDASCSSVATHLMTAQNEAYSRNPLLQFRTYETDVLRSQCWSGLKPGTLSRVSLSPPCRAFSILGVLTVRFHFHNSVGDCV